MFYLIVMLFVQVLGQETWRYFSDRSEQEFTTKDSIRMDYFGQQEVQWCFTNGCSLNKISAVSASMRCSVPGYHVVSPVRNKSMIRYFNVVHSPFCYDWHLAHYKIDNNESMDGFKVWIVDPMHSSNQEKNLTASLPSPFSAQLSTIFHKIGQQSVLTLKSGYRSIPSSLTIISKGFNYNRSYWEFITTAPITNVQEVVWMSGKSIAFHDCFIRDKEIQLLQPKYVFSYDNQEPQVQLTGGTEDPRLITDPCSPYIAVFISSGFVITQDNFRSTSHLYIPASLLEGMQPIVEDVSFLPNGNVMLLFKSGRVFVFNRITGLFTQSSGFTNGMILRLARTMTSYSDIPPTTKNPSFDGIAWSNVKGVATVFSSSDGGYTFNVLHVPWPVTSSWFIHEVVYHYFYQSYFFLVSDLSHPDKQPLVLEYAMEEKTWREHAVIFTNNTEGPLSFTFLPQSSNFVLIWSTKAIFYGGLNEQGTTIQLKTRDGTRPFRADATANISTICTGWSGEHIVVLNDGRMFYGRNDVSYIVEIYAGEPASSQISTMFDLTGRLMLITNSSDNFARRYFPLRNEVASAVFPDISCPYLEFLTNIPPELQYIDKGETKSFWASLMYYRASNNAITHQLSSLTLLDVTINEQLEFYPGIVMINKTFTFVKTKNNSNSQNSIFGTGAMSVLFHPKEARLTCKDISQKSLLIKVGCRPFRHVRIRDCTRPMQTENSTEVENTSYQDIVQCEFTSIVGKDIALVLDLYDSDEKVMEVTHDYILWEENNKHGYSYTATMAQNYESCFDSSGVSVPFDGNQPYQIINSTGMSRVTFTDEGRFNFTFKVVDPSLSFCTLTGRFTVMVRPGVDSKEFLPEIISMCVVILASLGFLCASFWFYRRETLGEHEQDRQTTERLQQLRSIYKGVRMSVDNTRTSQAGFRHSIRRTSGTAALMMGLDVKKSSQEGRLMVPSIEEGEECED